MVIQREVEVKGQQLGQRCSVIFSSWIVSVRLDSSYANITLLNATTLVVPLYKKWGCYLSAHRYVTKCWWCDRSLAHLHCGLFAEFSHLGVNLGFAGEDRESVIFIST